MENEHYIPPLRYRWLTRLYDPIVHWTTREAEFKRALMAQLAGARPRCVLDLGCGTGTLAIAIARSMPDTAVTGLDADHEALKIAAGKARRSAVKIELHQGFSDALPFEDARFDGVTSSLFFHHLTREAKLAALQEVRRVLAPGGVLHIADWGKPENVLMRCLFFPVQLLDGFETTRDSVIGALPELMRKSGFPETAETASFATPLGTMRLYRAA